ncbi:MAG TPA: hypothetical protein VGD50_05800, partial [Candidatus Baltobacteraceae bacterium]
MRRPLRLKIAGAACIAVAAASYAAFAGTIQRASIVVENQPLRSVLLSLSKRFGVDIVVGDKVSGAVSVSLHDVTLEHALTSILTPLHDRFFVVGGAYIVERPSAAAVAPAPAPAPARVVAAARPSATPGPQPVIINVALIPVDRAASVLRGLYPKASIHVDRASGALIIVASPDDVNGMRAVMQGIDVKNPTMPIVQAVPVQNMSPDVLAGRLRPLYPDAEINVAGKRGLLIKAPSAEMDQIKQLVSTVDQPPTAPSPPPATGEDAVHITQARPQDVARTVAHQFTRVRASVAGAVVVLSGDPDEIAKAKTLIAQIDLPAYASRFLEVYRMHTVDAKSVGDLVSRSFPDAQVTVDEDLNAISVMATTPEQQHISDSIAQLDTAANSGQGGTAAGTAGGVSGLEFVSLRSASPSQSSSSTGPDPTQAIVQTLQQIVPNVRVAQ